MSIEVVILAAGQGTRMKSCLPKVVHPLGGKPLLSHVLENAEKLQAEAVHVVIGHGADEVKARINNPAIDWVIQEKQLGTGHAVAQALPAVKDDSLVLVLYGDVPLTSAAVLTSLMKGVGQRQMGLLTVKLDSPMGYGRIVRDADDRVVAIVEQKDANSEQLAINEVNTGIMAVTAQHLKKWLPQLSSENAQGEYYLTDIIAMAVADGVLVSAIQAEEPLEVEGVNSRAQLAVLERFYQRQQADKLMAAGVTLADPARIDVRGEVSVGQDVFIDVNAVLEGQVDIGNDVSIGPNVVIKNAQIEDGAAILAYSHIEDARVGSNCQVGPYARLRPGTTLDANAKIGNFVEIKKANIGKGSKVNHLSYVGDAKLGCNVNVGAGTITCNYDGANKFETEIGDGVFVGSNTALVAPVTLGDNATIGAGSTISKSVPADALAISRAKQRDLGPWARPKKNS